MISNDDETAFPVAIGQTAADSKGMSLRDWFAGQALIGLLSHKYTLASMETAELSYEIANAMLEARNREPHERA